MTELDRFVRAQANTYGAALRELRAGEKRGHWMWFVLPQLRGLGHSAMSHRYGVASLDEARAYLAHPLLGPRLLACVEALLGLAGTDAARVLGPVDALKLRSCLTLFEAAGGGSAFAALLDRWYGGGRDRATLSILAGNARPPRSSDSL